MSRSTPLYAYTVQSFFFLNFLSDDQDFSVYYLKYFFSLKPNNEIGWMPKPMIIDGQNQMRVATKTTFHSDFPHNPHATCISAHNIFHIKGGDDAGLASKFFAFDITTFLLNKQRLAFITLLFNQTINCFFFTNGRTKERKCWIVKVVQCAVAVDSAVETSSTRVIVCSTKMLEVQMRKIWARDPHQLRPCCQICYMLCAETRAAQRADCVPRAK